MTGLRRDRQREGNEFLHRARCADAVERLDDEIGIAQPAVAIIPGAPGRRRFRYRRGVGGDDAAGLVEIGKLEGDGGADDRFLPIVGDRQATHPFQPIIMCAFGKLAAGRLQIASVGLVRTEHQMERPVEHERRLAFDQRKRCIRGQANHGRVAGITDMIAAERAIGHRLTVVPCGPHPDGDARQAGDWFDDPEKLRRPEYTAELAKARRKIGDPYFAAVLVGQLGADDCSIAHVFGMKLRHVVEHDVGESLFFLARDQTAEDRVAVEARVAPPD